MSRIFEALQKSDLDGNGFSFTTAEQELSELRLPPELLDPKETDAIDPSSFASLNLSVSPNSRLVTITDRDSLAAEKFRFMAVRLRQMQQNRSLKKLLITSSIPEEGKTTIAANLAVTLARRKQEKVLLVDGDMRRPQLAARFGIDHIAGLSDWLGGEEIDIPGIYKLEPAGFWFMPAGRRLENPVELMQSGRLAKLMSRIAASFDWIIVDSTPVLPLADAVVWARLVDGVILVTREATTEKKSLEKALQALGITNLLGLVVNSNTSAEHSDYYQRYGTEQAKPKVDEGIS